MSAVNAVFAQYNRKLEKLLINQHNIEILSIEPFNGPYGENTLVTLVADRSINADNEEVDVDEEHRYFNRTVNIVRHELKHVFNESVIGGMDWDDIFDLDLGVVKGKSDEHRDAFLAAISETHTLTADDVDAIVHRNYVSIVAKPNSLGFIGRVDITLEGESPEGE